MDNLSVTPDRALKMFLLLATYKTSGTVSLFFRILSVYYTDTYFKI